MTDLMFLVFAIDLVGVWMYGSAALYELLWRHLLRRAPTGGAAAALAALVYVGTYCLMLGMLWVLLGTQKPIDLASIAL
jgi:hypothetical protein